MPLSLIPDQERNAYQRSKVRAQTSGGGVLDSIKSGIVSAGEQVRFIQQPTGNLQQVQAPSGAPLIRKKGGNVLEDMQTGEPYVVDPRSPTGITNAFDAAEPKSIKGFLVSRVPGYGERVLGRDPVKEAEEKQKAEIGAEIDRYRQEGRPFFISKVTGKPRPRHAPGVWEKQQAEELAQAQERARTAPIDRELKGVNAELADPAMRSKTAKEIEELELAESSAAMLINNKVKQAKGLDDPLYQATPEEQQALAAQDPEAATALSALQQAQQAKAGMDAAKAKKQALEQREYKLRLKRDNPEAYKQLEVQELSTLQGPEFDQRIKGAYDSLAEEAALVSVQARQINEQLAEFQTGLAAINDEEAGQKAHGISAAQMQQFAEKREEVTQRAQQWKIDNQAELQDFKARQDALGQEKQVIMAALKLRQERAKAEPQKPQAPAIPGQPAKAEEPGAVSQLWDAVTTGLSQVLDSSRITFNAVTNDEQDLGTALASYGQTGAEYQSRATADDDALSTEYAKNAEEWNKAEGILASAKEGFDYVGIAAGHPFAAFKQAIQSAPNALISIASNVLGRAAGTAIGAIPGLAGGPAAIGTGIAGFVGGGVLANALMEAGPALFDILNERTGGKAAEMTPAQITEALKADPSIITDGLWKGGKRGLAIGLIESLGLYGAGRVASAPERALAKGVVAGTSKVGKVGRLAGAAAIETGAAGAGEAAAQVATGEAISPTDIWLEMLGDLAISPVATTLAKGSELAASGIKGQEKVSEVPADETADEQTQPFHLDPVNIEAAEKAIADWIPIPGELPKQFQPTFDEAGTETPAKLDPKTAAQTLMRIGRGESLLEMDGQELASVGLTNQGGKIKPTKDFEQPFVALEGPNGTEPVITEAATQFLEKQLPSVRPMIALSPKQRRQQINGTLKPDEQGTPQAPNPVGSAPSTTQGAAGSAKTGGQTASVPAVDQQPAQGQAEVAIPEEVTKLGGKLNQSKDGRVRQLTFATALDRDSALTQLRTAGFKIEGRGKIGKPGKQSYSVSFSAPESKPATQTTPAVGQKKAEAAPPTPAKETLKPKPPVTVADDIQQQSEAGKRTAKERGTGRVLANTVRLWSNVFTNLGYTVKTGKAAGGGGISVDLANKLLVVDVDRVIQQHSKLKNEAKIEQRLRATIREEVLHIVIRRELGNKPKEWWAMLPDEVKDASIRAYDNAYINEGLPAPQRSESVRAEEFARQLFQKEFWDELTEFAGIDPSFNEILQQILRDIMDALKSISSRQEFKPIAADIAQAQKIVADRLQQLGVLDKKQSPPARTQETAPKNPELEKAEAWHKRKIELINKMEGDPEQKAKQLKAEGMKFAAEKRRLTGNLTAKEQAAKDKYEASNYEGKPVSVDGQNATVVLTSFGRVRVKFADGSSRVVQAHEIQPPVMGTANSSVRPTPTKKPKAEKLGKNPLGTDILDWLQGNKIVLPPAQMRKGKGEYDALTTISPYYRKFIVKQSEGSVVGKGSPDTRAQEAYQDGMIAEPTADALYAKIQEAITGRNFIRAELLRSKRNEKHTEAQHRRFEKARVDGGENLNVDDLYEGDVVVLNGEKMEVTRVEHDEDGRVTNVTLKDGTTFGVQEITANQVMLVDEVIPAEYAVTADEFAPSEPLELQAESEAEMTARLAKEAQRKALEAKQNAPLQGNAGEYGTPDMLDNTVGDMALFSQPSQSPKAWAKQFPDAGVSNPPNKTDAPFDGEFKEGQISADRYGDDPYLYENRWVNPEDFRDIVKLEGLTYEQVVQMPTTQKYIQWYKEGRIPPPIDVVIREQDQRQFANNRRRIVAALEAGVKRIPARVEIGRASALQGKVFPPAVTPADSNPNEIERADKINATAASDQADLAKAEEALQPDTLSAPAISAITDTTLIDMMAATNREMPGAFIIPDRALSGTSSKWRDRNSAVQWLQSEEREEMSFKEEAEAAADILADRQGEAFVKAMVLEAAEKQKQLPPRLAMAWQMLSKRLAARAFASGNDSARRELDVLSYAFADIGTAQGQSLAARRDPWETPAQRMRKVIQDIARTPVNRKLRQRIDATQSPAEKSRKIRGLEKKLTDALVQGQADQATIQQLQRELTAARKSKDKADVLAAIAVENQQKLDAVMKQLGFSEYDVMLDNVDRLAAMESEPVEAAMAGLDKRKTEIAKRLMLGYSHAQIAKLTGASTKDIAAFHEAFRAKLETSLKSFLSQKGNSLQTMIEQGHAKDGDSLSAPKPINQRTLQAMNAANRQTVMNALGWLLPTAAQVNGGKLKQVTVVVGRGGRKVTLHVPYDPNNSAQVHRLARELQARQSTKFDKVYEYWINGILSGPQTQFVNVAGNVVSTSLHYAYQRPMEELVNLVMRNPEGPQVGEMRRLLSALRPALGEAWERAVEAFATEADTLRSRYLDQPVMIGQTDGTVDKIGGAARASIGGRKGRMIRMPGRLLRAADAFFKTTIARTEVAALAYRQGLADGLSGPQLEQFITNEITTYGSPSWHKALHQAEILTFQEDSGLARLGEMALRGNQAKRMREEAMKLRQKGLIDAAQSKEKAADSLETMARLLGFIFPFIRTPANIMLTGVRKSPIGAVGVLARMAGGLFSVAKGEAFFANYPQAVFAKHMVEQLAAWTAMAALWGMSEGDDDDDKKRVLLVGGIPYDPSKRGEIATRNRVYGGNYVMIFRDSEGKETGRFGFGRYEPIATVLGTVIDTIRSVKNVKKARSVGAVKGADASDAVAAIASNISSQIEDKTFFQGFSNLVRGFQDVTSGKMTGESMSKSAANTILTGLVPNIIRQPIRNIDETVRDQRYKSEVWYPAFPVSDFAEPMMDLYGREIRRDGPAAARVLMPFPNAPMNVAATDTILRNYIRNNPDEDNARYFSPLDKGDFYVTGPGKVKIPLTDPKQRLALETMAGQLFAQKQNQIAARLPRPLWQNPPKSIVDDIQKAKADAMRRARLTLGQPGILAQLSSR